MVDILRASTTMVSALANGISHIIPFAEKEACEGMRQKGYLIAGERNGLKLDGFDLGNSPREYLGNIHQGKKLAMTTTNGTIALEKASAEAGEVLVGAFINLQATVDYLKKKTEDILILCAGWKGRFNLEDTLYAGALAKALEEAFDSEDDAVIAAKDLWQLASGNLEAYMQQASHSKRLQNYDLELDQVFCFTLNKFNLVVASRFGQLIVLEE